MIARVERAVARRVSVAIGALAARARETLPRDVRVEAGEDGITLTGRRLRARSLTDARLRNVGR